MLSRNEARTAEEKNQVNVQMDAELTERLDEMCAHDERSRSGFMRWLIQQEWLRRNRAGLAKRVITKLSEPES